MKLLLAVSIAVVIGLTFGANVDRRSDFFMAMATFSGEDGILRSNNPATLKLRYRCYVTFAKAVEKNNADDSTGWTAEVNRFSIETEEEFKQNLGLNASGMELDRSMALRDDDYTLTLEEHANIEKRAITKDHTSKLPAIKNQGGCGSCWTFGATAALEYQVNRNSKSVKALSEQQYLDCVYEGSRDGCQGGWPTACYDWTKSHGSHMASAADYTYTAKDGTCNYKKYNNAIKGFTVSGYKYLTKGDAAMYTAVADATKGVMSVAVYVTDGFSSFKSGVFSSTKCQTSLNHAVDVVGYGTESGIPYWRVRNSWGASWGDNGHINMKRGTGGTNVNMCRIAEFAHYPLVSGGSDDGDDDDEDEEDDEDKEDDEDDSLFKCCFVYLKSDHGKFWSAQPNGNIEVNRSQMKAWERVYIERAYDDYVWIKSYHGKYLSAQSNGSLQWNRSHQMSWERFYVTRKGDKVAFKSHHGKWISAQPNGKMEVNRAQVGAWELFSVYPDVCLRH